MFTRAAFGPLGGRSPAPAIKDREYTSQTMRKTEVANTRKWGRTYSVATFKFSADSEAKKRDRTRHFVSQSLHRVTVMKRKQTRNEIADELKHWKKAAA